VEEATGVGGSVSGSTYDVHPTQGRYLAVSLINDAC
jgi:hypothetical protein